MVIIRDTEYTSWSGSLQNGWSRPGEHRELVHIGAVKIDKKINIIEEYSQYFLPQKNKKLSDYFVHLTGISQQTIKNSGVFFEEGIGKFNTWTDNFPLFSFGNDADVIEENMKLYNYSNELSLLDRCYDIRALFAFEEIPVNQYSSGTIHKYFGLPDKEKEHNALGDARNIVHGLKVMRQCI